MLKRLEDREMAEQEINLCASFNPASQRRLHS
jgi:hypothetical protein